eukprot:TRINITY_DN24570_c0_g1_i1.p1 TRINITY_DN24570_c0_g1~~TRINITY_DN24570_c0_g1_i1.p1  ORF type:complete len:126 (-),score=18.89 TRINITY_DN24570_c0_g1_i1:117-494(-)
MCIRDSPKSKCKKLLMKESSKKWLRSASVLRPIAAALLHRAERNSRNSLQSNSYQQLNLKEQVNLFCNRETVGSDLVNPKQLFKKGSLVKFCALKALLIPRLREKCKMKPHKVINLANWNNPNKF